MYHILSSLGNDLLNSNASQNFTFGLNYTEEMIRSSRMRQFRFLLIAVIILGLAQISLAQEQEIDALMEEGLHAYWISTDDEGALEIFNTIISLDETYGDAYVYRGAIHREYGDLDTAFDEMEKALDRNPQSALAYSMRARVYADAEAYEAAFNDANHAIDLDSQTWLTYYNRGRIYQSIGYFEEAVADFDNATELGNYMPALLYAESFIHYDLGDLESALDYLNQGIAEFPESPLGYLYGNRAMHAGD
jgi:tetratricopeptide (TPR) repeat protein